MSFVVSIVEPIKQNLEHYFVVVIFVIYYVGGESTICGRLHFPNMFTAIFPGSHALANLANTTLSTRSLWISPFQLGRGCIALTKRV